jgi:hypothetical protein
MIGCSSQDYDIWFPRQLLRENLTISIPPQGPAVIPVEHFQKLRVQSHSNPTLGYLEYSPGSGWHQVGGSWDGIERTLVCDGNEWVPVIRKGACAVEDAELVVYATEPQFGFCLSGDISPSQSTIAVWDVAQLSGADSVKLPLNPSGNQNVTRYISGQSTSIGPDTVSSLTTNLSVFSVLGERGWWGEDGLFRISIAYSDSTTPTLYYGPDVDHALIVQSPRSRSHLIIPSSIQTGWYYWLTASSDSGFQTFTPMHAVPERFINLTPPVVVVWINADSLHLGWSQVPSATSYEIQVADTIGGVFSYLTTTPDTLICLSPNLAARRFYRVIARHD